MRLRLKDQVVRKGFGGRGGGEGGDCSGPGSSFTSVLIWELQWSNLEGKLGISCQVFFLLLSQRVAAVLFPKISKTVFSLI
jgi:hypothetical protein